MFYVRNLWSLVKINWKLLIIRTVIAFVGLFLASLGTKIYLPLTVGSGNVDLAIFSLLAVFIPGAIQTTNGDTTKIGKVDPNINANNYYLYLMLFYFILLLLVILFTVLQCVRDYKKNKDREIISRAIILIFGDIVLMFVGPLFLQIHQGYFEYSGFQNWLIDISQQKSPASYLAMVWVFFGAFVLYCFGVAILVWSRVFNGPYNSVATQFMALTKWNYLQSRILWDVIIFLFGMTLLLSTPNYSWEVKVAFFSNYLVFGMIIFTFGTGLAINFFLPILRKIWDHDKIFLSVQEYEKRLKAIEEINSQNSKSASMK
ncbi:SPE_1075/MLC_0560 family membrane protein [Spiroplasma endosymbiont of Panorpa germanica]|uniref:SPE_1075/MLC_0560 family membrane protein n=1 Tax=Spiroplasma endosymbiont of Panorpa germanica TaxID=3066314 RepID=UPI0030CFE3E8